jgi:hypothetical protein
VHLSNFTEENVESIVNNLFSDNNKFISIEDAYQQLAKKMCESFNNDGKPSDLILSRVYHSFDFPLLPPSLQQVAKQVWKEEALPTSKFIALMGTYGDESGWCDRNQSQGHKAILLSHQSLNKIPMVSRLLQQIGFDMGVLLGEKGIEFGGISGTYGVFYVSPALGSPYIPAQDFVKKYDVKSVLGTGVMLPQGDISIYIGFSRVEVTNEVAANIASLMSLFWQHAFPLLEERGMFS